MIFSLLKSKLRILCTIFFDFALKFKKGFLVLFIEPTKFSSDINDSGVSNFGENTI
jgi:hypothetical protein